MKKSKRSPDGLTGVRKIRHFEKKIFGEWPLKNGEWMRVSVENYEGYDLVQVRRWARDSEGEPRPTRKGIAIGINQLRRVLRALQSVLEHAREIGLLAPPSRSR
jgi:Transcriptional Coactivator p15 (PC4)